MQRSELYDLFYDWKDYRAEAEKVRELVAARNPDARTLLDVACGTGSHLVHLRDWFAVEGLDINAELLKVAAGRLPAHHADPFDRMLIAQAQIEGFTLVSVDRRFSDYDIELVPEP